MSFRRWRAVSVPICGFSPTSDLGPGLNPGLFCRWLSIRSAHVRFHTDTQHPRLRLESEGFHISLCHDHDYWIHSRTCHPLE